MMTQKTFGQKMLSILLCMALLLAYVPASAFPAKAATVGNYTAVSDPSTMDNWQMYFPVTGTLTTENAGGVWTDKSVFTDAGAFPGVSLPADGRSFLVALSAIGSNMTVSGMSQSPTDTILVLDVSGSMNNNDNGVADELVQAANASLASLLGMNDYNRVGVVLYSGPSTTTSFADSGDITLLLPLDRYTTTSTTNGGAPSYLTYGTYNGEAIGVASGVRNSGGSRPTGSKTVSGGTYIQGGINKALEQFQTVTETTVEDPVLGSVKRTPILVMMSDGAPTLGTTNFTFASGGNTDPYRHNMGTGAATSPAIGFVTQLTAAYAKGQIETKYGTDCLFYTLGLGLDPNASNLSSTERAELAIAQSVMDTNISHAGMSELWRQYDTQSSVAVGDILVQYVGGRTGWRTEDGYVTPISAALNPDYVTEAFAVSTDSSNVGADLIAAFKAIVEAIQMQSKYYPTLVSGDEDLSGYVSFVDQIGHYMTVTDVKGINIGSTIFTGERMAQATVDGSLGTADNLTALGDELIWSIKERLGITDADVARTLVGLAYQHNQLYYDPNTGDYSNFIGWQADANGSFLAFYQEGVSEIVSGAVSVVKSYIFLGQTDPTLGVEASDMMYTTVRVMHDIATGDEMVSFAIPAALLPVVTYSVSLNADGTLQSITASGATAPIELLYQVSLDSHIDEYNVKDAVSDAYLAYQVNCADDPSHNGPVTLNSDGSVNFYSNRFSLTHTTGYGLTNTYSYFTPSKQNDQYYFTSDAQIFTDTAGTPYTGSAQPSGTMYRRETVYTSNGVQVQYFQLTQVALDQAVTQGGAWYVPKGTIRQNAHSYDLPKTANPTGTLHWAAVPYVDISQVNPDGTGYLVGTTLPNNGRLTLTPATGIEIAKVFDGTSSESFVFHLDAALADGAYTARHIDADGNITTGVVSFNGGKATVSLKAGEKLQIVGIPAGTVVNVVEEPGESFILSSVTGLTGGAATVVAGSIVNVTFTNTSRGSGNLTVAKEVTHDFGAAYQIPAGKTFTMNVTLTLNGAPYANKTVTAQQTGSTITSVTTDADGEFAVVLQHNQQIELLNLPEGVVATVVESDPGTGFAPIYHENGVQETVEPYGQVTVEANRTVSVIVVNDYTATRVYPVNIEVMGNKTLTGRDWQDGDSFQFQLQKYMGTDSTGNPIWEMMGSAVTVTKDTANHAFSFTDAFATEAYTQAGVYNYRVVEIEPATGALGGVTYDKTVHGFAVEVADLDMDGALEIVSVTASRPSTVITSQDVGGVLTWTVDTSFVNVYDASSADVFVEIQKQVNNPSLSSLASRKDFVFEVYEYTLNGTDVVLGNKVATSLATTETGTTRIQLPFHAVGTYHYAVKEVAGSTAGWTYSDEILLITVDVVDDGQGHLVASVYLDSQGSTGATNTLSLMFTNLYDPADASLPIDFVRKMISGRDMKAGEFTFAVYNADVDGNSVGSPVLTGTNSAAAQGAAAAANLGTLTFDKVGVYLYNIVETSTDGNGVSVDKNVYRVIVTVTDVGGALSASYVLVNAVGNDILFTNSYTTQNVSYALQGNKTLRGRTLLNDEFTFVLTEALDAEGNVAPGAVTYTATNLLDGTFQFPSITYAVAGTYYYVVSEKVITGSTYGIQYDTTQYVVTLVVTDNGLGNLVVSSVSYAIVGNGVANAISFVNQYTANPTSAQLPGNKELTGKILNSGDFTFDLYYSDSSWSQGSLKESVSNDANGDFRFTDLYYASAGTYYYLVKERNAGQTIDGVTYDSTVYRVKVTVTDDLRGQLHAQMLITDGNNVPQLGIKFVNSYTVYGSADLSIAGLKTLTGRQWLDSDTFTFQLFEADWVDATQSYVVVGDAIREVTATKAAPGFQFDLSYTSADVGQVYYYAVKEVKGGTTVDGVAYSNLVYFVEVHVKDDGVGGIITEAYVLLNGQESALRFANSYTVTPIQVPLAGSKVLQVLQGNLPMVDGNYTFQLYSADASFNEGALLQTVYNTGTSFSFQDLTFSQAGTYYYLVKETNTDRYGQTNEGMVYDPTVYQITVTVTDNLDGTLSYVLLINGAAGTAMEFVNRYTADETSVTFSGSKNLTGRDMADGEFTFNLHKTGSNYVFNDGNRVATATNSASGAFTFLAQTLTTVGEHYFVIVEQNNGQTLNGVAYDETVYQILVTVTDDGNGKLVASAPVITRVTGQGSENASAVTFRNGYTADPASVTLAGDKDLTVAVGQTHAMTPGEFTFHLYKTGADFDITGLTPVSVKTNGVDGNFTFDQVSLTTAGEHYFAITEVHGSLGGITYDHAHYHVVVTVTDDGLGQLVAGTPQITKVHGGTSSSATEIKFVNHYDAGAASVDFEGNKNLSLAPGSQRPVHQGEFTFQLYKTDSTYAITGLTPIQEVSNDALGGFDFTVDNLTAEGSHYFVITEKAGSLGGITYDVAQYHIHVDVSHDGAGVMSSKILSITKVLPTGSQTVTSIQFTNGYDSAPTSFDLSGTKELSGRALAAGEFSFLVYETGADYDFTGLTPVQEVSNALNGSFSFQDIPLESVGVHYFAVVEKSGNLGGVSYDDAVYQVKITVTDDGNGQLVAGTPEIIGGPILFRNTYTTTSTHISISGHKELSGRDLAANEFTFLLYKTDSDYDITGHTPLEQKNNASGDFRFDVTGLAVVGEHYFVLTEKSGTLGGVTYDETEYRILVTVSDNGDGTLSAVITSITKVMGGNSQSVTSVLFENTYKAAPAAIDFLGGKTITGRDLEDGEFSFLLYKTAADYIVTDDPIQTAANAADGVIAFLNVSMDTAGDHYFVVREEQGDKGGVSYDDTEYRIHVLVTDNGDGTMSAQIVSRTRVKNGQSSAAASLSFENGYTTESVTLTDFLLGHKVLDVVQGDRDLANGEFSFDLYETGSDFVITGTPKETVTNDADGNFAFSHITYTQAGTYYYVVKENSQDPINGVTYDTAEYHITVKVVDNLLGQLVIEEKTMVKVEDGNSTVATELEFVNSYSALHTTVSLGGNKVLTGRALEEGEFSFLLYHANASFVIDETVPAMKATNKADGSFAFDALTYTAVGTYHYVIVEDTSVQADRVTFDQSIYHVTVTVTDDGNGKLVASQPVIVKAGQSADRIVFENVYVPKPADIQAEIDVLKSVQNLGTEKIGPKDFQIQLRDVATGQIYVQKTDESGIVTFGFTFTEDDIGKTYQYVVTEINDGKEYVGYDASEFHVSITVTLGQDNKLVAAMTVNGEAKDQILLNFVNTYTHNKDVPPTGDNSILPLWTVLFLLSGLGLAAMVVTGKKKEEIQ